MPVYVINTNTALKAGVRSGISASGGVALSAVSLESRYAKSQKPLTEGNLNISAYGIFGKPVFSDVYLISANKTVILKNVICVITMDKNIVTTAMQGRKGTVKEYISNGDYQVQLTGTIDNTDINDPYSYPEAAVQELINMLDVADSLEFQSRFLRFFDITNLLVRNYKFSQRSGSGSNQEFEISCLSDEAVELVIKEEGNV